MESGLAQLDAKEDRTEPAGGRTSRCTGKDSIQDGKKVKAQEKKLEPARKEIQEKEAQLQSSLRKRSMLQRQELIQPGSVRGEREAELASGEAQIRGE